jgi:steroid delta-isomerase-like uncharacterized protein
MTSLAFAPSRWALALLACLACACGGEPPRAAAPIGSATTPAATPPPAPTEVARTPTSKPAPTLAELEQKTLAAAFDAMNAHEAKRLASVYSESAVMDAVGTPPAKGKDAIASAWQRMFDAVSGFRASPTRLFLKGDVAVVEWAWSGTHSGELFGAAATEKPVGTAAANVVWFTPDGAIKEQHVYFDVATVLAQVGRSKQKVRVVPTVMASPPQVVVATNGPGEAKLLDVAAQMYGAFATKSEADFLAVLADDLVWDELAMPEVAEGKAAAKKWFGMTTGAWTDPKRTTRSAWAFASASAERAEGWVITEGVFTGKHTGRLGDLAPTKKDVAVHQLDLVRVQGGKIVKGTSYGNAAELAAQLAGKPGQPAASPTRPASRAK